MSSLLEKIERAREKWAKVGEYEFLIRRPTLFQMRNWSRRGPGGTAIESQPDLIRLAVVNWRGIKENELVPGGTDETPPFEVEALIAFAEDRPSLMVDLIEAVYDSVNQFNAQKDDLTKK